MKIKNTKEFFKAIEKAAADNDCYTIFEFLNLETIDYSSVEHALLSRRYTLQSFGFCERFSISVSEIEEFTQRLKDEQDYESCHSGI